MKRLRIGTISILVAAMLAGCATAPREQDGASVEDRTKPLGPEAMKPKPPTDTTTKPLKDTPVAGNPLKDPGNILSRRSVFLTLLDLTKDDFSAVSATPRYLQHNHAANCGLGAQCDDRRQPRVHLLSASAGLTQ